MKDIALKLLGLLMWPKSHLSEKSFLLALAFVVGLLAAVAAFVLHSLIHEIQTLLTGRFNNDEINWLYLVYPVIGILITMLFVRYVVRDNIGHGITRILQAISLNRSRIKGHNCWSSVVASAVTIGFGGSVGAEAPIVLTGSAIGSNLGKFFNLTNKQMMMLVGCGAAGAIAGIFKAPIAGLVFTLEVLMIDLTMASLLPILISCCTATCFTYIFLGDSSLFDFHLSSSWTVERAPATILLGVFCGLVSLYFIRTMTVCEDIFAKMKKHPYGKLILGGATLSLLIFCLPSLYGEGYRDINVLLNGRTMADWQQVMDNSLFYGEHSLFGDGIRLGLSARLIIYVSLVILCKVVATSATNGGGGCGGTFAPSLFIGCFAGFLFARVWNIYNIGIYIPEQNFALLGMAGVMSGVMHAPLTGIFLIAEITLGYNMFMPLMICSVSSYLTIIIFEPHSIYGMRLAKQGRLITHHTDNAVLTLMSLDSVVDRENIHVSPDDELVDIVHKISASNLRVLPVLDAAGMLLGEIDIHKIRHVMFRTELYHHFTATQLMSEPDETLYDDMPMTDVVRRFDRTSADSLPVLNRQNLFKGYISRQRMYGMYRKMVKDMSQE